MMTMRNEMAAVILTHGRAERVKTIPTLRRYGYTGPIYLLVDTEDEQIDAYRSLPEVDAVWTFEKTSYDARVDTMANWPGRKIVLYARCAVWDYVRDAGYRYFIMLDDDYTRFRSLSAPDGGLLATKTLRGSLDDICDIYVDFLRETPPIVKTVCFAQGGDIVGGVRQNKDLRRGLVKRKAMNVFFCDVERPLRFSGRLNEDVNMSLDEALRGNICLTPMLTSIEQTQTQASAGGLTPEYLDVGTYVKSFFSVMLAPSAVTVRQLANSATERMHHWVRWRNVAPYIMREPSR